MADKEENKTEINQKTATFGDKTQQNWTNNFPEANHCDSTRYSGNGAGNTFVYPETQYKNVREYAQAVQCWLWQYRMFTAFATLQSHMLASVSRNASYLQNASSSRIPSARTAGGTAASAGGELAGGAAGTQYKIPMLWRRVLAEFLDFVLLFYAKILVTVAVLRQMGYMNEEFLDIDSQFPFLSDLGELDYDKVFSLTSELIALEVINRLCITLVETLCLRQGYAGSVGGATPGKKMMQLKVVSFTEIRDLRNGHVLVVGAKDPGFFSALIRSIIKNFSMAFFFPACFTAFFFRFNRAAYDVIAQTIVVEVENRPPHH